MKKILAILTALALLLTTGTLALAEGAVETPAEITTEFPAAVAANDIADFNGTWTVSKVSMFGMVFDAASLGNMITINDGNMSMTIDNGKVSFIGKDGGEFAFEDGKLVMTLDTTELTEEIAKLTESAQAAANELSGQLGELAGSLSGLTESLGVDLNNLDLGSLLGGGSTGETGTTEATGSADAGLGAMLGSLLGQFSVDGADLKPTIDLHEDGTICFNCMGIRFLFEKAE